MLLSPTHPSPPPGPPPPAGEVSVAVRVSTCLDPRPTFREETRKGRRGGRLGEAMVPCARSLRSGFRWLTPSLDRLCEGTGEGPMMESDGCNDGCARGAPGGRQRWRAAGIGRNTAAFCARLRDVAAVFGTARRLTPPLPPRSPARTPQGPAADPGPGPAPRCARTARAPLAPTGSAPRPRPRRSHRHRHPHWTRRRRRRRRPPPARR